MIHGLESLFLSKTIDAFNKSQYFRSLQTFLKTCQLLFPVENTAIFQNKCLHIYLSVVNNKNTVGTSCMDKNTGSGYKSCHSFPSLLKWRRCVRV